MVKRASWLSVTPEPERELPEAVATLAGGRRARPDEVVRERERIERLVLHGSQRRWLAYLHEVVGVDRRRVRRRTIPTSRRPANARSRVIANHHNLLLALPGAARRTAGDRAAGTIELRARERSEQPRNQRGTG